MTIRIGGDYEHKCHVVMAQDIAMLAYSFEAEAQGDTESICNNEVRYRTMKLLAALSYVDELEDHFDSHCEKIAKLEAEIALLKSCGMAVAQ